MTEATLPLRVGLIGNGAIGRSVVRHASAYPAQIQIVGILTRTPLDRASPPITGSVDDFLALAPDVVVEAAGHAALREHGPVALAHGCDLVALSVGAMADAEFEQDIRAAMTRGGSRMIVASGAVGALDAIGAAAIGGISTVTHTTRKPARSLLPEKEAATLQEPREVFAGPAREAALRYPENVNVSAAVSLAGIGFDRTIVRVIADPRTARNIHEVEVEGEFGHLRFEISNIPSDDNPKSARLAAMSVVYTLMHIAQRRHAQPHTTALSSGPLHIGPGDTLSSLA